MASLPVKQVGKAHGPWESAHQWRLLTEKDSSSDACVGRGCWLKEAENAQSSRDTRVYILESKTGKSTESWSAQVVVGEVGKVKG